MSRYGIGYLLTIILLGTAIPAGAGEGAKVLSDEVCQAPFVLSVPAELVRSNRGLSIVVHDDGAEQRLVFDLGLEAVAVRLRLGEKMSELARAAAPLPGAGGLVVVKRLPKGFAVAYDGVTVLRGKADLPDSGRWGFVGAQAAALDQISMQPIDEVQFSDDFMRMPNDPTLWEDLSGKWRIAQLDSARYSANAFTLLGNATKSKPALTAAGYWFWEDLTVEASVRPSPGATGFGLGLACGSDGAMYLMRFTGRQGPSGVVQLVRVRGGRESVLAEAPAVAPPDDWHRFALSGVDGRLTGTLDGVELVAAPAPDLAHGKIALWVAGTEPVAFDDVEAYSGPREVQKPVVLSHEAQSADPGAQAFIGDQYMQQWADERDQWSAGADGMWHGGYYWGDVALSWELTEGVLRNKSQLHTCVPAGADTLSPDASAAAGCHLDLATAEDGKLALTLREGQQSRVDKTIAMPELPATATLRRVGDTIEALIGGEVVASAKATVPAAGKVGLTAPYARSQAGRLGIISRNVIDSTFRSAPTDWTIGSGEWGVSSRWACTPRWSWFQGRAEDLASIWTRRQFTGDLVVEFFAGIPMDQPWAPFYRHPGNLAVTLSGQDGTPGSGYSLVFAGWGNSASGIFRRGELVAKVPGIVMPDILDSLGGIAGREEAHKLHNEWRRIRAERIGRTVRLLVDGKVAASFDDPDPLPGGAVGIWTLNQAITVARARVYYESAQYALPQVAARPAVNIRKPLPLSPFGPPRRVTTFEDGLSGWKAVAPGACRVELAERDAKAADRCLEVVNPTAGGSFALAAPFTGLNLREHSLLAFDYAIPATVHVDLFATVAGQRYRVALSGPKESAPGSEDVGRIAAASADGGWETARLDLLGLLGPHFPGEAPIVLQTLEFAAYAVPEYTRAGIGGNPAGASWRLDNVYLGGVAPADVSVATPLDVSVSAPRCRVNRTLGQAGATHQISPGDSGLAAVTMTSGAAATTDLVAFDLHPPKLQTIEPQPGASWLGPVLAVALSDAGPAGIYEQSLQLRFGGRRFGLADRALRWNPVEGKLTLDLREASLQPVPGQPVEVVVEASDRAGNRATPLQFTFTPAIKADTTPPDAPTLVGALAARVDCDLEADLGPVQPWGADAAVALRRAHDPVAGHPQGGDWCLEARSTKLGGLFGVSLGVTPFEASRYPVLEFDYRASADLRVDLIVEVDGRRRVIKFTDNDQTWPVIGRVGAVADDRWHRATIDLHGMLARAFGRSAPLAITNLAFASSGWPGNRESTRWWLDNIRLQSAINVSSFPAALALHSRDESGLAGFAWVVDDSPGTEPPAGVQSQDLRKSLAPHAGTRAWLHAAAVDGAGNRSEAAVIPLRLVTDEDTQPPVASAPVPADGASACPRTISIKVADAGSGVSPADLRLTINGQSWSIADKALSWDATSGQLTWSLPAGLSLGADGSRVECRLTAGDLAGSALPALEWTFKLSHALGKEPPAAPVVSYVPARCADGNDFEEGTGGWGDFWNSQVLRLAQGGATGPGCAELRHLGGQDRDSGFVLVRDFGEDWRQFPVVRFRYRAVNAPYASLQVFGTTFDGNTERWTPLGTFPVSGEEWLSAELDIAKALRRTNQSLDIHRIFLSVTLPPDGALLVDDYAMYSEAATRAAFRWAEPSSQSGIAGYSWVLDSSDATMPPEKLMGSARQAEFTDLKPGRYVFHLRACDGAGNWGPASHVSFRLTEPAPAVKSAGQQ
ncbi:MAG: hypothetical protein ACYC63_15020 [Armatimonadota bacterium]